ncbi:MAG: GtrA family protein [Actinomycetaceae bacterium]|nr:GtrA family protein [Actinomycetaceae bacterium]
MKSQLPNHVHIGPWSIPKERLIEILRFCIVGGANYIVDLLVFNILLFTVFWSLPITAKVFAVSVATLFSWVANRQWTFRQRRTGHLTRELVSFIVVNILGMLPALVCLQVSHYWMGLTSPLADNISANVIGLIIGTILRYVFYRRFVFTGDSFHTS